jgi:endonuclease/exonuclease/phosphatase family metal-dependent hydrolase
MRIVTWNLWWRYGPWQERRSAIAATLTDLAPDVCGLQEVWGGAVQTGNTGNPAADTGNPAGAAGNLAADLADRLGMHWCWAPVPISARHRAAHGGDLAIGNAVLSRWPIAHRATLPLPVADGEQPRVALHARIDTPAGPLPFFTTHLTHRPDASAERVAQVRELAGFVAGHLDGAAYPPVVTGDFNAMPDSDEMRLAGGLLTAPAAGGPVLVDAWRYAAGDEPGNTWEVANPYVGDVGLFDARVDYVLVGLPRGARGRVRSGARAGVRPVEGVVPSDHYAVVADRTD